MFVIEARASTILYNFLMANPTRGKYLLPANICPIVPLTFLKAKVGFDLVDISLDTYRVNESKLVSILHAQKDKYAGVLYTHPYGEMDTPLRFFQSIKNIHKDIAIIDDRCLCLPNFEEPETNAIDLVLWSSGYGKMVDLGSGGFGWISTDRNYFSLKLPFSAVDLVNQEKQYKLAIQESKKFSYHESNWLETQLFWDRHTFCSEVKKALHKSLPERLLINEIYERNIPKKYQFSKQYQTWRFNISIPNKSELIHRLFAKQMFASSHYASLGPAFSDTGYFENTEKVARSVVNLFNDHHYNTEMAKMTCDIINEHLLLEGEST